MAVRRTIAETVRRPLKRVGVKTPILDKISLPARIISSSEFVFPAAMGIIPVIARGKAYGDVAGVWYKVFFPRVIRDASVVAIGEGRAGEIPDIEAPTISVPKVTVTIPTVSVKVASAGVPKISDIKVPKIDLPAIPTALGRFECGWMISGICDGLNDMIVILERGLRRINELRDKLDATLGQVKSSMDRMDAKVDDLRAKVNTAFDDLRKNSQASINDGLKKLRANVQTGTDTALGKLASNVGGAVNDGLARVLPGLYDAWGIPRTMALTPLHVRNVTSSSFEFQSYGKTTCYYIAVGRRL